MTHAYKKVFAVFAVLILLNILAWIFIEPAKATNDKKVTICHATSSETNPFVTITISENAVYGPGGHFNENGTTQAGHEQDYFGECKEDEEPPPFDQCPNIEGNQPAGTDCNPVVPPPVNPPGDRCPPGMTPTAGKDGEEGNDECEYPKPPETSTPPVPPSVPPVTPTQPPVVVSPKPSTPTTKPSKPIKQNELEEELEEQAEENGATKAPPTTPQASDTLPYTGIPLLPVALLGAGMTGLGAWLRRRP